MNKELIEAIIGMAAIVLIGYAFTLFTSGL